MIYPNKPSNEYPSKYLNEYSNKIFNELQNEFYDNILLKTEPYECFHTDITAEFIIECSEELRKIFGTKFTIGAAKDIILQLHLAIKTLFNSNNAELEMLNALYIFKYFIYYSQDFSIRNEYYYIKILHDLVDKQISKYDKILIKEKNPWFAKELAEKVYVCDGVRAERKIIQLTKNPLNKHNMMHQMVQPDQMELEGCLYIKFLKNNSRAQIGFMFPGNYNPWLKKINKLPENWRIPATVPLLHITLHEKIQPNLVHKLAKNLIKKYAFKDYSNLPDYVRKLYRECNIDPQNKNELILLEYRVKIRILYGVLVKVFSTIVPSRGIAKCYRGYFKEVLDFIDLCNRGLDTDGVSIAPLVSSKSEQSALEQNIPVTMNNKNKFTFHEGQKIDYGLHLTTVYYERQVNQLLFRFFEYWKTERKK